MEDIISADFTDQVLLVLNSFRTGLGLSEVLNAMGEAINEHAYTRMSVFDVNGDGDSAAALASLQDLFANGGLSADSEEYKLASASEITHCEAVLLDNQVTISYQNKYLELASQGPAIEGSLVVQGNIIANGVRPVFCKVHFEGESAAGERTEEEILLGPWCFIMQMGTDEENSSFGNFTIPVQGLPSDQSGVVKVWIYVNKPGASENSEEAQTLNNLFEDEPGEEAKNAFFQSAASANVLAIELTVEARTAADDFADVANAGEAAGAEAVSASRSHASSPPNVVMKNAAAERYSMPVICSVKLAADQDEMSSLRAQGYELTCVHVDQDGNSEEQEGVWPFYIMAKYGQANGDDGLVLAVDFVNVPKGSGDSDSVEAEGESKGGSDLPPAITEVPGAGHMIETFIHFDLSAADSTDRVFLRVTSSVGASGVDASTSAYHRLTMLSAGSGNGEGAADAAADESRPPQGPEIIQSFLLSRASSDGGAPHSFVPFPVEVTRRLGFAVNSCGLLLQTLANDASGGVFGESSEAFGGIAEGGDFASAGQGGNFDAGEDEENLASAAAAAAAANFDDRGVNLENDEEADDRMSHMTGERSEEEGASEMGDEPTVNEYTLANELEAKAAELEQLHAALLAENVEQQKKSIVLILREKALSSGQKASTAKDMTAAGATGGGGPQAGEAVDDNEAANERTAEKEKILSETYTSIIASRSKINQQTCDYDQLAHDLQTRLDDREYKANEITESFRLFKSEILAKAENTRTSQPLSKKLTKQFEVAQAKREEDLERVRLRNISMRTSLLRLERQLRNREQLAEGLHMIDFEQLKVENQTLYEKIEERTEELTKLNRKKTNTVQVLTHVREKLRFIEKTNLALNENLSVVENDSMDKRGTLTGGKKARDLVRDDNKELRRKQGFASSSGLLVDFEKRTKSLGDAHASLKELQNKYNLLATQCARDEQYVSDMQTGTARFSGNSGVGASLSRYQGKGGGPGGKGLTSADGMQFTGGGVSRGGGGGGGLQPQTPYFPGAKPGSAPEGQMSYLPQSK